MVFNNAGRILQESHGFAFEGNPLKSVKEYTYLGITMTLTGSYKVATSNLRKKALRGYFALRKMVDWKKAKTYEHYQADGVLGEANSNVCMPGLAAVSLRK